MPLMHPSKKLRHMLLLWFLIASVAAHAPYIVKWRDGNHTYLKEQMLHDYRPHGYLASTLQLTDHDAHALATHPLVEFVVADGRVHHDAVSASTPALYAQHAPSWGLARISRRIWDASTDLYTFPAPSGRHVDVYVFDTGVDASHPDFQGRIASQVNFVQDEPNTDTNGHGTHVMGTIGGTLYGVAKRARLHAYKVLDSEGEGNASTVIQALLHLIRVRQHSKNLCVVNLSLHTGNNRALDQVIEQASRAGIAIITSSANEHLDTCKLSPGGSKHVLAVGSTTIHDTVMPSSGRGACVRIFAPGKDIISAWPNESVHTMSGTSMAAPHIAGIASLFLSQRPYSNSREVIQDILNASTKGALVGTTHANNLAFNGVIS
jgi:subtilisin family serine protease